MEWEIYIKRKLLKQIERYPENVRKAVRSLSLDLRVNGPVLGKWSHFGKLEEGIYHCHLTNGRPTYVAVWEVLNREIRLIEVTYVGTHEKAPY